MLVMSVSSRAGCSKWIVSEECFDSLMQRLPKGADLSLVDNVIVPAQVKRNVFFALRDQNCLLVKCVGKANFVEGLQEIVWVILSVFRAEAACK